MPSLPTNLILYGPPGVGKTYATAKYAVELCGETAPADRRELMVRYRELMAQERIEFVTFHQSMSYEEFVEGLRPTTRDGDDSAGFHLKPTPGIFRRIAKRAQCAPAVNRPVAANGGANGGAGGSRISVGDQAVYQMAIGRSGHPEEAHLFDEAIAGNYILIDGEEIDWTDSKYEKEEAIRDALGETDVKAQNVWNIKYFRNCLRKDNFVVVYMAPDRFRAVGQCIGDYEFHPRPGGRYSHRRAVHWLRVDPNGVSSRHIYRKQLVGTPITGMNKSDIISSALDNFINNTAAVDLESTAKIALEGRNVFKMSLGRANDRAQAYVFEEAIKEGRILLGHVDRDFSDDRFSEQKSIKEECSAVDIIDKTGKASRAVIAQMLHCMRNQMCIGDIVIVAKGNLRFRAIGQITGDYQYRERPKGDYGHQRTVRWLWVDPEGESVKKISTVNFYQQSVYMTQINNLDLRAIEGYMNSTPGLEARDENIVDNSAAGPPHVLIIDEINRANISKVFGELITLLEPDKRLRQVNELTVRLPYSRDTFGVPSNLHILGTMNTADRSIALLDTALRRRFTFREIVPDPGLLSTDIDGIDLCKLLTILNERIEYLYDRDHRIGHAYFIDCQSRDDVDAVMRDRVIPLLAEYFFDDWSKIAAVLGDLQQGDGKFGGRFLTRTVLPRPPGTEQDRLPRFRWEVRASTSERSAFDYSDFPARGAERERSKVNGDSGLASETGEPGHPAGAETSGTSDDP